MVAIYNDTFMSFELQLYLTGSIVIYMNGLSSEVSSGMLLNSYLVITIASAKDIIKSSAQLNLHT